MFGRSECLDCGILEFGMFGIFEKTGFKNFGPTTIPCATSPQNLFFFKMFLHDPGQ